MFSIVLKRNNPKRGHRISSTSPIKKLNAFQGDEPGNPAARLRHQGEKANSNYKAL